MNIRIKIQLRAPRELGLRSISSQVEIVVTPSGHLSEQDYVTPFLSSDVVIMPYLASEYAYSGSGVFVDAVTLGCMPIVSKRTTMASELVKFGLSELTVYWDTDFSWDFVAGVAQDVVIRHKFCKMTLAYRAKHCLPSFAEAIAKNIYMGP
jgi:hypothetical protein